MSRMVPRRRPRARVLALDVLVGGWVASWAVLAVLVAVEVRGLGDLSRTVTSSGVAVEESGRLLARLGALPIVGGDVAASAEDVVAAGQQAQRSGRSSRRSVRRLSVLLAVTIAILPSAPLVVYLPWRIRVARERRTLRRLISRGGLADEAVLELLARRAVQRLPYGALLVISDDPWGDIRAGRHERLALAELARAGVVPRTRRDTAVGS